MFIKKTEITELSDCVRKAIDGQQVDLRDNKEGAMSILKNDIHTLVNIKNEQLDVVKQDQDRMTEYVSNISHQLKTPITSMMIMAELLESAPPEKQIEFIANLKMSLTRMDWLVTSLLKMAKLDSGAIEFVYEWVTAEQLLKNALKPLEILLDVKNQRVELLQNQEIYCDKRWTTEALTNIVKNASEYSPENSIICVECGANPIYKWIAVRDAGNGIQREMMAKIFRRFEGSRSEKGYGIGLPLALSIMRGQKGDIDVDGGGKGQGATFTMKFFQVSE
ncbi:MAG: HAMP domain-containing sensor histidine kinase [Hespellia sp.]|nr:HAMP domain-containing sensor histidine kinase [Hespellia sp.]